MDGSDRDFRRLVHALFGLFARHDAIRAGHAARIDLAGVEYTVLISIGHLCAEEGAVSVSRIAEHLRLSGAFVTTVTNKLAKRNLIGKLPDPDDRRKLKLEITPEGWARLAGLAPFQREVNDVQFGPISAREFRDLLRVSQLLIDSSDRALNVQRHLRDLPDKESSGPAQPASRPAR